MCPIPTNSICLTLPDENATRSLAEKLSGIIDSGDIIALSGTLGTGKTAFSRAFIIARTGSPQEVPSPTFTLLQTYDAVDHTTAQPIIIYHFDLYRLSSPDEAFELGIDDAFADGICLIEWPDRLGTYLPARRLELRLAQGEAENARIVTLGGHPDIMSRVAKLFPASQNPDNLIESAPSDA